MSYFGVIADDLTGAMDAGMQMFDKELTVRVALSIENFTSVTEGSDLVVVNTQSRNCGAKEAYDRVRQALEQFLESGCNVIYKKIDSTLRGHIGAELKAVLDSDTFDCILVAPAIPFNKRTTENGIHYVNNIELAKTDLAKDPFSPVNHSAIAEVIKQELDKPSALLNLELVRKGGPAISKELDRLTQKGIKVIIADAVEEKDLKNIAFGAKLFHGNKMLCGSAGLFKYFDKTYDIKSRSSQTMDQQKKIVQSGPMLTISGSPADMSKKQIEYTRQQEGMNVIDFDITSIPPKEVVIKAKDVIDRVIDSLDSGCDTVIDVAGESKESILERFRGDEEKLNEEKVLILEFISHLVSTVAAKSSIAGLILFGGDTAVAIADCLDARGIEIKGQLEPYIPWGVFIGGDLPELPVVTKAGGFGKKNSLINIINRLRGGGFYA